MDKRVPMYNTGGKVNWCSLNIYHVTFGEIRRLVAKLEPWEEIDAEIFDDSFVWFVAITHEDIVLLYGL